MLQNFWPLAAVLLLIPSVALGADEPPIRVTDQPLATYAPKDSGPADEQVIFTPEGFNKVGTPAQADPETAGTLQLTIRDRATGEPTFCRVNVVGADGNYYEPADHPLKTYSLTGEWPTPGAWGNRVGKAPIRYLGRFFYCSGQAEIAVPPGPVRIEVWKGFEFAPKTLVTEVQTGKTRAVELELERTAAMSEHAYYNGDPHLHLPRLGDDDEQRILDLLEAEDIQYGTLLAYNEPAGPYAGFMNRMDSPQRALGQRSIASRGNYQIVSGQEYRSATYGHLNLFLLDDLVLSGQSHNANNWPLYGDLARSAREFGGVAVYAHGGYAQAIYADVVQDNIDAVELLQFGIYRGIGLVDWYHLLNSGFRFPIVGASDYPACRHLGDARTYVHLPEQRDIATWIKRAAGGHSFVTTGPLLLMQVDQQLPGSIIERPEGEATEVTVHLRVRSEIAPVTQVQLVVNGRIVRELEVPKKQRQGSWVEWQLPLQLEESSWIAARAFSLSRVGTPDAEAHTNPVYVYFGDRAPYRQESLDAIVAQIDKQIAIHRGRTFEEKAKVLAYFERSRDILLKIREAGGAPAQGHPSQIADLGPQIDPGKREHTEEELKAFLKPVPPKPIEEVLRTFETVDRFEMQLLAREPQVYDPVAATFDEDGNLYVCELRDYPYKPKEGRDPLGTVRLLRDTDGDGIFDSSTVFADKLLWPAGVVPWKGGVFVAAPPNIWYFKDTDGDGQADVRRKVFTGFGTENQQAMVNNLQFGFDHYIYGSTAGNGGSIRRADDPNSEPISVNGRDFRFHPETLKFEAITGTIQFGNTFDDWGHRFLCSESQPLLHEVLPQHYLARNPYLPVPYAIYNAAPPPVPVFRISPIERWRMIRSGRRLLHTTRAAEGAGVSHHVVDAAAGVTVYRGGAYPEKYYGSVFVGDAQNNLIHRRELVPNGLTFNSRRGEENTEFVRSPDNWFRPVNFINAPDGTLYVLDMSREIIEAIHIPLDVVKHLDLRSGRDFGRIYRLAPPSFQYPGPPQLSKATTAELVEAFESPHGWWRDTAHRLIFERQDKSAVELLRQLLRASKVPQARLLALWSLEGLGALADEDCLQGLADENPYVRIHALRLSEDRLDRSPEVRQRVTSLVADDHLEVRFQLAFTLGESAAAECVQAIARLIRESGDDAWMRAALLSSVATTSDRVLDELLNDSAFAASGAGIDFLRQLVLIVGSRGEPKQVVRVLEALAQRAPPAAAPQLVESLGAGLKRHGDRLPTGDSLGSAARPFLAGLIENAQQQALDEHLAPAARSAALQLLGCMPLDTSQETLVAALEAQHPEPVQIAAVRVLADYPDAHVAQILLDGLRSFPPEVQKQTLAVLLAREDRTLPLLERAAAGEITLISLDASQRARLTQHRRDDIRTLAEQIFGASSNTSRSEVVAQYRAALELQGDVQRGLAVFRRDCAACHKIGDIGYSVGPDLTSIASGEPEALLTHVLDPSQYVLPNYLQYVIQDVNGRTFNGLISAQSETSVTLLREEGRSETLLRSEIETMSSTGKSLMPEGLEQKISIPEMADLLAYLDSVRAAEPSEPAGPPPLDVGTRPGLIEPE